MAESKYAFAGLKPEFLKSDAVPGSADFAPASELTAVERFSIHHDSVASPSLNRHYRELMPASPPGPGQQYAFEVDLDRCTACKACVVACHNLNGLEDTEIWRNTGLLIGGTNQQPFQQTITTTCHHCVDPACLNGCPVNAYEKNAITGIVKHLDDQCIGCKYCTLTCPYDVPTFSNVKGIVRKCDMCSDRLSVGEAPACVQACPNEAILIKVVDVADIVDRSEVGTFLPGTPSPEITMPTTSYVSRRTLPQNLLPADFYAVTKEDPELPLVFMLVLSQLSVGTFLWDLLLRAIGGAAVGAEGQAMYSTGAVVIGWLALAASMMHLGRPLYAFRALLGLRHSWLSREILTLGLYVISATLYVASFWTGAMSTWAPSVILQWLDSAWFRNLTFGGTILFGSLGVFCSVKVYDVTRRELWCGAITGFKFATTTLLLGAVMILAGRECASGGRGLLDFPGRGLCLALALVTTAKLCQELSVLFHVKDTLHSPTRRAAILLTGPLRRVNTVRILAGIIGGLAVPCSMPWLSGVSMIQWIVGGSFLSLLLGEVLERYLFFTTGVATRMPGGHAA